MSRVHRHRLSRQRLAQLTSALLANGYLPGFLQGRIFTGASKAVCVPMLNCYSCPGALGSCPIGALQAVLGRGSVPFYVLGTLMLFGLVLGRAICGLLCPFGLVQDLLQKLPFRKRELPLRLDRALRWVKYVVLALLVVILPASVAAAQGIAPPFFCEWLCPAGTLGGALPLMATNPSLRALAGVLFSWKLAVLVAIVALAVIIPRPFCRYLCPLGAFYSFFNRVSLVQLQLNRARCSGCGHCAKACPMALTPHKTPQSGECIRCGACARQCPQSALRVGFCVGGERESVVQSNKSHV